MRTTTLILLTLVVVVTTLTACMHRAAKPSDADTLVRIGVSHARAERYDEAIASYDKAIKVTPEDARAYLYRGVISGITGNFDAAAADHLTVLKLDLLSPEDAAYEHGQWHGSFTMWTVYLRSGDFDRAIADYDTFTRLSPDEADAYMWRGCAYYLKSEDERAIADYDSALAIDPDNAFTLFMRGLSHARLGSPSRAQQDFIRALDIGFYGLTSEGADFAQAHKDAEQQTSETHEQQGVFHFTRALDRLSAADYDNAVADMDKARNLIDPKLIHLYTDDMHQVYFQSGVAYYDTGLYDDAIILFDKAIDAVPSPSNYPAAYFHRGMSHFRKSSYRRAIADFDEVIHLEQDYPDAAHYRQLSQENLPE